MSATARALSGRPPAGHWLTPEVASVGPRYAGDLQAVCLGTLSREAFADRWRWCVPEAVAMLLALSEPEFEECALAYLAERARGQAERLGQAETTAIPEWYTAEERTARWGALWLPPRLVVLCWVAAVRVMPEGALWAEWEAYGWVRYHQDGALMVDPGEEEPA